MKTYGAKLMGRWDYMAGYWVSVEAQSKEEAARLLDEEYGQDFIVYDLEEHTEERK